MRSRTAAFFHFQEKLRPDFATPVPRFLSFFFHVFIFVVSVLFPTDEVCKICKTFRLIVKCSINYYYVHIVLLLILQMHINGKEHCCIILILVSAVRSMHVKNFHTFPLLYLRYLPSWKYTDISIQIAPLLSRVHES